MSLRIPTLRKRKSSNLDFMKTTRLNPDSAGGTPKARCAELKAIAPRPSAIFFAWLVFHAVACWCVVSKWWRFKRICAWHPGGARRFGGNPFARRQTHGLCAKCAAVQMAEVRRQTSGFCPPAPAAPLSPEVEKGSAVSSGSFSPPPKPRPAPLAPPRGEIFLNAGI